MPRGAEVRNLRSARPRPAGAETGRTLPVSLTSAQQLGLCPNWSFPEQRKTCRQECCCCGRLWGPLGKHPSGSLNTFSFLLYCVLCFAVPAFSVPKRAPEKMKPVSEVSKTNHKARTELFSHCVWNSVEVNEDAGTQMFPVTLRITRQAQPVLMT